MISWSAINKRKRKRRRNVSGDSQMLTRGAESLQDDLTSGLNLDPSLNLHTITLKQNHIVQIMKVALKYKTTRIVFTTLKISASAFLGCRDCKEICIGLFILKHINLIQQV